ncbi:hypothetical protein ETB97_001832 [Aspergillus alliaceus]|uniref:phosphoethanolamine N-methyltransferase n=1 Tax=Petromyces alliaceus TaxID=209559 RepID=A0A5N7CGM8_PETAA|nr:S-adenosyl-L-methionine-dependent methyltransferase [Aspergillus alliaceus]KAF5860189.1 hypothetical protein ETB97_001832 [Aspergillus burnettii]
MTKADYYGPTSGSTGSSYQNAYANDHVLLKFIDRALSHLPPQSHTLDVGCGTGNPLDVALEAAGHHVSGIDLSPTMVELSRKNVPGGTFHTADMKSYEPPKDTRLDAVFNVRALFNHTRQDIEECVGKWGRWLRRDGLLCMVVIEADGMDPKKMQGGFDKDGRCAKFNRRFMGHEEVHSLFTRAGWKHLLRENGFEVVDELVDRFVPPAWVDSDDMPQYCFVARKVE